MDTPDTNRAAAIEQRATRRFKEGQAIAPAPVVPPEFQPEPKDYGQADPLAEAGAIIAATAETAENKYLAVSRRKELYLPCSTSESLEYLQGRADGLAALCTALGIETAAPLPPADRDRIIRGLCQGKAPHDHGQADSLDDCLGAHDQGLKLTRLLTPDPLDSALDACDGELDLND